jgi:hypothetical protein
MHEVKICVIYIMNKLSFELHYINVHLYDFMIWLYITWCYCDMGHWLIASTYMIMISVQINHYINMVILWYFACSKTLMLSQNSDWLKIRQNAKINEDSKETIIIIWIKCKQSKREIGISIAEEWCHPMIYLPWTQNNVYIHYTRSPNNLYRSR